MNAVCTFASAMILCASRRAASFWDDQVPATAIVPSVGQLQTKQPGAHDLDVIGAMQNITLTL